LNSAQLKLAANGLFVSAENFVRCHYEENWIPPILQLEAALEELAALVEGSISEEEE
jgi:hypothetical protein